MGEGGCGSRNPTCFLLTFITMLKEKEMPFDPWRMGQKGLQSFPEKGNEEGGIRGDLRSLKPQNFSNISTSPVTTRKKKVIYMFID